MNPKSILVRGQQNVSQAAVKSAITKGPSRDRPAPWTTSQLSEARHVLRALLRETTYLPDRLARVYFRHHVLSRFRDYTWGSKPKSLLISRREGQIALARKGLAQLVRANAGVLWSLRNVLLLAYGRKGKRRHDLMKPLLSVETPQTATALSIDEKGDPVDAPTSADSAAVTPVKDLPTLTGKLRDLLASQMQASPPQGVRTGPKRLTPKIPETNAWKRPMPQKRVANMIKVWYADMLNRVHPPLPPREWDHLRRLSTGEATWEGPRLRRASFTRDGNDRLSIVREKAISHRDKAPHKLTPRYMSRCYAHVFSHCPVATYDAAFDRWRFVWGCTVLKRSIRQRLIMPESDSTIAGVTRSAQPERDESEDFLMSDLEIEEGLTEDWTEDLMGDLAEKE